MQKWIGRPFILIVIAALSLFLFGTGKPGQAGDLAFHFIDVGQGDAILIKTDEAAILIDGGPRSDTVLQYLQSIGVSRLDLVVATHAHSDHIAGLITVLEKLPVAEVWYNGQTHTTRTFERFVDAILASDARYHEPVRGEARRYGSLVVQVLHPTGSAKDSTEHVHEHGIVLRVEDQGVSAVFTGDVERSVEAQLIKAKLKLSANILKLGHHGSRTSSGREFLLAVKPQVAIYQAAQGNSYGHPHAETVNTLRELNIPVYGTDTLGTIVITVDGAGIRIRSSKGAANGNATRGGNAQGIDIVIPIRKAWNPMRSSEPEQVAA